MTTDITIRSLHLDDTAALYTIYSDAEAMKYRGSAPMQSLEDAQQYVAHSDHYNQGTRTLRKAVVLTNTQTLLGSVMFRFQDSQPSKCEIGYSIGRSFWGQGLGKTIVGAMLQDLEQQPIIQTITAWSHQDNKASIKILEQWGFEQVAQEGAAYLYRKDNKPALKTKD